MTTLISRAVPSTVNPIVKNIALAFAGSLFIALFAQISVPMFPVPMTMQTFAILAIGLAYGSRLGSATVVLYLIEGAAGLPVFANASFGVTVLVGATGGYLFGFVAAAAVTGFLAEKGFANSLVKTYIATLIGTATIFAFGLVQLGVFVGYENVLKFGFYPFIVGGLVKAAIASGLFKVLWNKYSK